MADITTDQVEQFNNKQKAFRERLVQMKKEKEESKSTCHLSSLFLVYCITR